MFRKKHEDPGLDKAIEEAIRTLDPLSKEYLQNVEGLERLYQLKEKSNSRISPDTLATIAANLAGILLILNHERLHPIATKSLSLLHKLK